MEELDEFEGGEEVDYDFNLDDDLLNEETEPQAASTVPGTMPASDASAAQPVVPIAEPKAEPKAEPQSELKTEPAIASTPAAVAAAAAAPAPAKPKKHKFTGLEEIETPSSAAPATYQPPTQEQIMAQRLKEATQMAKDQQRGRVPIPGVGARPFQPNRGGARPLSGGRGPAANGRGGPRLDSRPSSGRGDGQRGGRGMPGRAGPPGRGVAGRGLTGRGRLRPGQNPADRPRGPGNSGSGLQFNRPSGPPIPPSQPSWMAGRGAASSSGPQRGLNPTAPTFLPMPPGLPMPNGMGFDPMSRLKQMAGSMFGGSQRAGGGRGILDRLNGSSQDWDPRSGDGSARWGDNDRESGRSRPRSGGPPKLVGDFDAGEEFEPPKKRPTPNLRDFGALGDRPGLALPPMGRPPPGDPPKPAPTAAELEAAEKARKRQEEEAARKAAIQKRIDAQKEENALLTRLRELERQVEMNKIRDSIAKLEAQAAAGATPVVAKPPPAAKPAPVPAASQRVPTAAARKPPASAPEASLAKRKTEARIEAEPARLAKRTRSPARSRSPPPSSRSRSRQVGEADPPRPDRMRSSGSGRYNEEPSHERASQDLREYLEQKKQRSKRPESDGEYKRSGRVGR